MLADVEEEMKVLSIPTFDDYLGALENFFIIDDIETWPPAIRSNIMNRKEMKFR